MSDTCLLCFEDIQRGISLLDYFKPPDCICGKCRSQFEICDKIVVVKGLKIHALYYYNTYFEDVMFTFKENRDIALAPVFLHPFINKLKKRYHDYVVVYAPSSQAKERQRGFATLQLLFEMLPLEKQVLFVKNKEYKQSEQIYKNRHLVLDVIERNIARLPNRNILLVDDMCTSGATLSAMYALVKEHWHKVEILTIGINKKLL